MKSIKEIAAETKIERVRQEKDLKREQIHMGVDKIDYKGNFGAQTEKLNTGFCDKCNEGIIYSEPDERGYTYASYCDCWYRKRTLENLEKSGLINQIEKFDFESYKTDKEWQAKIKQKAQDFAKNTGNSWFYIGGAVGSGKTHICTAIAKAFILEKSFNTKYIRWRETARDLKAIANEREYAKEINKLVRQRVLYIDDFLKVARGAEPTTADLNIAFEILDGRYSRKKAITIISSEHSLEEVHFFDEALSSRIFERTERDKYLVTIKKEPGKNKRYYPNK